MNDLNLIEKTAFGYSSNFQDKKKIAELRKEIELLKEELERERRLNNDDDIKIISTIDDFVMIICERLSIDDRLKLIAALKKQQNTGIYQPDNSRNVDYIARRIFKTRPAKKAALINTIKTMFQDEITDSEIEKIILDLQKRNFIKMIESKITYL